MGRVIKAAAVLAFLACASATPVHAGELQDAAQMGDTEKVEMLVKAGGNLDEQASNGETALTLAILGGHLETVKALIDAGASISGRNAGGFTPLHAAAYAGQPGIAKLLVDKGADVGDRQNKAGVSPLSIAAEEGQTGTVRALISLGADVEITEQNGYTPLTRAIWRDHQDVIAILQAAGAKCQAVEILEEPAHSACMAGQKQ